MKKNSNKTNSNTVSDNVSEVTQATSKYSSIIDLAWLINALLNHKGAHELDDDTLFSFFSALCSLYLMPKQENYIPLTECLAVINAMSNYQEQVDYSSDLYVGILKLLTLYSTRGLDLTLQQMPQENNNIVSLFQVDATKSFFDVIKKTLENIKLKLMGDGLLPKLSDECLQTVEKIRELKPLYISSDKLEKPIEMYMDDYLNHMAIRLELTEEGSEAAENIKSEALSFLKTLETYFEKNAYVLT